MSEQEKNTLSDLDEILGSSPSEGSELESLVNELLSVTEIASNAERRKSEIKNTLLARMDEIGVTSMTVAGRKIYTSTRTYYGIDRNQLPEAKAWMEAVAPDINIPATDKVKKAVDLWMDEHPGEDLPGFITKSESVSLGNRKA
jgi:hypothetical protein